ncbi:glycoside hydrolase family 27 protein [Saccharopolyspora sp. K220]|uniref:glycoside hydrolase family 27 protein n=1 Tax=Saccharopolyspora soli TaxID=2926618 RepID=UPI001F56CBAF|nr:glycoside hydrolase family 27 protein [Saccharopolyspora soli]MCI2420613.1 glycoside hydrolase family 27 protein [Saccharopolyspora soli]
MLDRPIQRRSGRTGRGLLAALLAGVLSLLSLFVVAVPASAGEDQGAPDYYNSGLAPTPYMGWNTYFGLGAPSESEVKSVADFLVSSGLRDAGYRYVWIDGGWTAPQPRDAQGNLLADPAKFPSGMPALVDYLHSRNLLAGIYTDAGASDGKNCAAGSGGGYYDADAKRFAAWQFDAIKIDFLCGIAQNLKPAEVFAEFSQAVQRAGRPMLLNLCNPVTDEWDVPHGPDQVADIAYTYGPTIADSWRTSTDVAFGTPYEGIWKDVLRNMDRNAAHPEANGPGHYNDPDYLIPMRRTEQGSYELNEEESTTQLVMWAEMAAPLIIGSDPRTLPASMIDALKNPEIVAVNQDPLAIQGVRVATTGDTDVYSKVLSGNGERAVVLLNRGESPAPITVNFADAGLHGPVAVRDLRARADQGAATGSYTATVPAHGTAFLRLRGTDLVPGTDLGGDTTASPALVRFDDTHAMVFARDKNGALQQRTLSGATWSENWQHLGGPTSGRMLGQPAAFASADGRVDLFVRGLDNAAYQRTFRAGNWGPWIRLGGTLTDSPSVAFTSPDSWTLFARGADGEVWAREQTGEWTSVGAPDDKAIYGRPGAAVDASGTHIAVRTPDDSIWVRSKDNSGTWSPWSSIGGTVSGSPTLVANDGRISLLARANDYTLWQIDRTNGAWSGWFKRTEFASNSLLGAIGATAGEQGAVWTALRGPNGHIYQTTL